MADDINREDEQEMGIEETGAVPPLHTPGQTSSGDEADVASVDEDELDDADSEDDADDEEEDEEAQS